MFAAGALPRQSTTDFSHSRLTRRQPSPDEPAAAGFLWDYFLHGATETCINPEQEAERLARYCLAVYGPEKGKEALRRHWRPHDDDDDQRLETLWEKNVDGIIRKLTFVGGRLAIVQADDEPSNDRKRPRANPPENVAPQPLTKNTAYIHLSELMPTNGRFGFNHILKKAGEVEPEFVIDDAVYYVLVRLDAVFNETAAAMAVNMLSDGRMAGGHPINARTIGRMLAKIEDKLTEEGHKPEDLRWRTGGDLKKLVRQVWLLVRAIKSDGDEMTKAALRLLLFGRSLSEFRRIVAESAGKVLRFVHRVDTFGAEVLHPTATKRPARRPIPLAFLFHAHLAAEGFSNYLCMRFGGEERQRFVIVVQKPEARPDELTDLAKEVLNMQTLQRVAVGDAWLLPEAVVQSEKGAGEIYFIIRGESQEFGKNFVGALLRMYRGELPKYIRLVERREFINPVEDQTAEEDEYLKIIEENLVNQLRKRKNKNIGV